MKRLKVLIITLFVITSRLIGQDFGAIGTQWYYSEHAGGFCFGNCEYLHLESIKDTMINGKLTHKIVQKYFRQTGDVLILDAIYVYEKLDTVYMYDFSKSRFLKLYIFNGNQGDTLTLDAPDNLSWTDLTYRLVIDTVINTTIDGVPLKKFGTIALDDYQFYSAGYFMDRIGGLDWFFPRAGIILEAGGPIRCYSDSQIDTSFQSVACDYLLITSIDNVTDNYGIEIFPIPASNMLTIKSDMLVDKFELLDLSGKIVLTTKEMTMDTSGLTSGQYLLIITLGTGQKIERKIIKNAR